MFGKRLIASGIVMSLVLSFMILMMPAEAKFNQAPPPEVVTHNYEIDVCVDLIAGQNMDVGCVHIWNDEVNGDILKVQFIIDDSSQLANDEWFIKSTKVSVHGSPLDFPMTKKHNPVPGQFESKINYDMPGVQVSEIHEINMDTIDGLKNGEWPLVAAHADVCRYGGLMGLEHAVEDLGFVSMQVSYPYPDGPSYFPNVEITNGGFLNGDYVGWCVDTDHTIGTGVYPCVNVYSSMGDFPEGLVENPENFDLVNWILNNKFVGKQSIGYGTFTYGDVQRAIWQLIDDGQSTSSLNEWNQNRVDQILDAAKMHEDYMPGCGDIVAVIFAPVSCTMAQVIIGQVIIGEIGISCGNQCETAWGNGTPFSSLGASQWGMFIKTDAPIQCSCDA